MSSYLRELSFSEIFRGSFKIYFHHFFTILLLYALPVYPISYLMGEATVHSEWGLYIILFIIGLLMSSLAYAAITVTLSDICLGNKPGIIRSYKYVFGPMIWKLLATNLLQILIITIGLALLVVPGVIFMFWLVFVSIIVILENTWGIAALKRSKSLGKDYYLRTFGLILCMIIVLLPLTVPLTLLQGQLPIALTIAIQVMLQPLGIIILVLSYYDLRARKEAFDTVALAEDLQH